MSRRNDRSFRPVQPQRLDLEVAAAPRAVREIAWKAQCRLSARYRALIRKGKLKTVAVTAVARELSAFIWAINRQVANPGAAAR